MKRSPDIKQARFYLLLGLAYGTLWFLGNLSTFTGTVWQAIANNAWRMVYLVVLNFIFFEYSVPFVLEKKRYLVFNVFFGILLLWIHCILWAYGMYWWRELGIRLGVYARLISFASMGKALSAQMGYSVGSVFFFGLIRHLYNYVKLKQATQQLLIEKQAAELNYLKSQTNPHFLFNTLNNIYSLARDKSDLAPESILRLSKILRFMLYETSGQYISIEQELKIMDDYIALEKLRYDESLDVRIHHDIEDMRQALPPLLLIPLVENAFKHGVAETRHRPFVDIHLSVRQRQLLFVVKNSTDKEPGEQTVKENIGLANLRRQLELLFRDHELFVKQSASDFTATLKINLASHV
jgi:two-component system LytT family sensor kinase